MSRTAFSFFRIREGQVMVCPSAGPHSDKQWYIRFPCMCRMRTYPHPQALACARKLQVGTFAHIYCLFQDWARIPVPLCSRDYLLIQLIQIDVLCCFISSYNHIHPDHVRNRWVWKLQARRLRGRIIRINYQFIRWWELFTMKYFKVAIATFERSNISWSIRKRK